MTVDEMQTDKKAEHTVNQNTVPGDYVPAVLTHSDGGISDYNITKCIKTTFEILAFCAKKPSVESYLMQLVHKDCPV